MITRIATTTCLALTLLCHAPGAQNNALSLNGIDAYGTASTGSFSVSSTTWEAWVRVPALDPQFNYAGTVLSRWGLWNHYAPNVNAATGEVHGVCGFGGCTSVTGSITPGGWHHLAVVFDSNPSPGWTLFIDGSVAAVEGPGTQIPTVTWQLILGAHNYLGYNGFLKGEIDEARISSVQRYGGPFVPQLTFTPDASTIALWHLDEGGGSVAYDAGPGGRHLQLHGGYQWVGGASNDCNANGVADAQDLASGSSMDCNQNGLPDECDIAGGTSLDLDGNGVPDSCIPPPLAVDLLEISISSGGTQSFSLDAGPTNALELYLLLGSASGTAPGIPLNGLVLPVNYPDSYFQLTLVQSNSPTHSGTFGVLDAQGRAAASLNLPGGVLQSGTIGLVLNHAFMVLDGFPLQVVFTSNPAPVTLIP